jgi:hypothetical protein
MFIMDKSFLTQVDYEEVGDNEFQDYLMRLIKNMSVKIEKKSSAKSDTDSSKKGKASPSFVTKI